ncbi:hypothetical protein Bca52824_040372 [Brassica carinata]|uniref:Uncharacterized protein n=1 Tax=Brassica carinata TaxID=52824 RepID=A0A8X7RUR3_BRACI|nr:hypothetical protein Bca52824_040372 [Brassica carinata]
MGTIPDLSAIIAAQLGLTSGEGPSMAVPRADEVFPSYARTAGKGKKRKRCDGSGVERSTEETMKERNARLLLMPPARVIPRKLLLISRGNDEDDDERRSPVLTSPRERTPVPVGGGAVQTGTSSRGAALLRRAPGFSFPDKVDFHYEGPAPLVYVPEKCGEFLCQLRGRAKPLPAVKDLIFGGEYEEAARAKLLGDSTMNVVIDKYDTALKGALDELELANKEFAEKEEVSAPALESSRRIIRKLEQKNADLESERASLASTHEREMKRLRDSRILEVMRERGRVEAEMTAKADRCFAKIRSREERRGPYDEARLLYSQAFGTRKLSPLALESQFVDARILAGLDPYGSNAGLIDPEKVRRKVNLHVSSTHPVGERRTVLEEEVLVEGRDSPPPEESRRDGEENTGEVSEDAAVQVSPIAHESSVRASELSALNDRESDREA